MKWASNKGFTIVELLVVIVVISILATITLVGYTVVRRSADESKISSYASQIKSHLQASRTLNGGKYYLQASESPLSTSLSSDFAEIAGDASVMTTYISSPDQRKMCATVRTAKGGFSATITDYRGNGNVSINIQDRRTHCPPSL